MMLRGAATALLVLVLAGCATIGPAGPPSERAPAERAPAERPPAVDDATFDRWARAKDKRYAGYLGRAVLPLLEADITHIKRKGYAASVSRLGLDHVHVRYSREHAPAGAAHLRDGADWHHLHYHGIEDIAETVAAWRSELELVARGEMKDWLAGNRAAQFDYERFFFGDGVYVPPPAIPRAELKAYARRWWKFGAGPGAAGSRSGATRLWEAPAGLVYRRTVDRLIMVIGAEQPGYPDAAARILAGRSTVAGRLRPVPMPTNLRFLDGYYHPVTIYLHAFGVAGTPEGGRAYRYRTGLRDFRQLETR